MVGDNWNVAGSIARFIRAFESCFGVRDHSDTPARAWTQGRNAQFTESAFLQANSTVQRARRDREIPGC